MFGSFVEFITAHYELYSLSFYGAILVYIWYALGWFFSTDYYDRYVEGFQDPNEIVMSNVFITIILVTCGLLIGIIGVSSGIALSLYSIFWMIFVLPFTFTHILNFRQSLRKKRGKS